MAKTKRVYDDLWTDVEKIAAKRAWIERLSIDPAAAWKEVATNCAKHASEELFSRRRGMYAITDAVTASGEAICFFNNNPYKKAGYGNAIDHARRDRETDIFRLKLNDAGIRELGYATWPPPDEPSAGYSYAMILEATNDQGWLIRDAMYRAIEEGEELVETSDDGLESMAESETQSSADLFNAGSMVKVGVVERVGQVRVGQGAFSCAVRENFGHRCCFPGCTVDHDALLIAGHIVRWADSIESAGDVANGLCLCGLHDKAFECGLFTLSDEFCVQVNSSKAQDSEWAGSHLKFADGLPIKHGRLPPSVEAVRQHRASHGS